MALVSDYQRLPDENWGRFYTAHDGTTSFNGWRKDGNRERFGTAQPGEVQLVDSPIMAVVQGSDFILTYIHISVLKEYLEGEETTS